jgi:hypothetical protein
MQYNSSQTAGLEAGGIKVDAQGFGFSIDLFASCILIHAQVFNLNTIVEFYEFTEEFNAQIM